MEKIMELFASFTGRSPSLSYRLLSLIPGTLVFLILSPLVLFFIGRYLSALMPLSINRFLELVIASAALLAALVLMFRATVSLWIDGRGTPAPIAPTEKLVTSGLYGLTRNPIELGTNLYFFALGTWFDNLVTGLLCMVMGLILGYGYLKLIEEQELRYRFGSNYDAYLADTAMFLPSFRARKPLDRG